jgi:hypothetical protein
LFAGAEALAKDRAAPLAHPVIRHRRRGDAVQPSRFAADAKARLINMAHRRRGEPCGDGLHLAFSSHSLISLIQMPSNRSGDAYRMMYIALLQVHS